MLYACVSLSCSRLCHAWHSYQVCGCVVTSDAHEALFRCNHLGDAGCFVHTFPLFHFVRWYAYHACLCHSLAFCASLHTCLHVHAWVLLASVSSMLQHNEAMDIRSKPKFVPCGHHLFFCFLACLPSRLFACFIVSLLAMSTMLIHFMHFYMLFASFPSIACLLVSCLCLCMYTHGARTYRARARSPKHKQKGRRCEHVSISQAAVFSRFRGLAFPIWFCTL